MSPYSSDRQALDVKKLEWSNKKFFNIFSRVDTILHAASQTDGQTDTEVLLFLVSLLLLVVVVVVVVLVKIERSLGFSND